MKYTNFLFIQWLSKYKKLQFVQWLLKYKNLKTKNLSKGCQIKDGTIYLTAAARV